MVGHHEGLLIRVRCLRKGKQDSARRETEKEELPATDRGQRSNASYKEVVYNVCKSVRPDAPDQQQEEEAGSTRRGDQRVVLNIEPTSRIDAKEGPKST